MSGSPATVRPVPRDALVQLLRDAQADLRDYGRLAAALEQQFGGALRHDAAALSSIAAEIMELTEVLEQRRQVRVRLVSGILGTATAPSMAALFARLPAAARAPIEALWQRLERSVAQCRERNLRNARLMTEQQALMQRVLHGDENHVYADA